MPVEESVHASEALIRELFESRYERLKKGAEVILDRSGAEYSGLAERVDDIVQNVFLLAWEKREEGLASPKPEGWLYRAMNFKVWEALREERTWRDRLSLASEATSFSSVSPILPLKWEGIMTQEEYTMLYKVHVVGLSYTELAREMGLSYNALAMRMKRLKDRIREKIEKI